MLSCTKAHPWWIFVSNTLEKKRKRCSSCFSSLTKLYGHFISDSHFMLFFLKFGRQPKPVLNTFEKRIVLLWNGETVFYSFGSCLFLHNWIWCTAWCLYFVSAWESLMDWQCRSLTQGTLFCFFTCWVCSLSTSFSFFFHLNKNICSKRHFKWVRQ